MSLDDPTFESLKAALAASPDNPHLLGLVLNGHLQRGEADEACARLAELDGESLTPELRLLEARARLETGDRDGARAAYDAAVAKNPTLQDVDLEARLGATERVVEAGGDRPRLRVISNDDTDEEEVERLLGPPAEKVTFEDVGGLEQVKKEIHRRIILPFKKPGLFQRFRKRAGGGILLYGPPGCGKTLLARATAGECDAAFFDVAISDVLDMYIGESERKLHALFEKARASAPAVLFFDELEALAGRRQYHREGSAAKVVSQFLSDMDGFGQDNQGVLILGATNVPWSVDPAFRRPGRFDRMLFVTPPDAPARLAILELLLRDRPVDPKLKASAFVKPTQGFSGADLKNLVETAADEAIEASLAAESEIPISAGHMKAALEQVRPTTTEWLTTARNYARYANEGGQYDEVLAFLHRHAKK